jgi:hypothetical protein
MEYRANITRRVKTTRTYVVLKRVNERTNAFSRMIQRMIDKYIIKKTV